MPCEHSTWLNICISAIIVQTVHVICKQLIQRTTNSRKAKSPTPWTAHTTTHTHTCTLAHPLKRSTVCVCCLPAQFVSNLICILTTFCVWLKQRWARGGEEQRTGLSSKKKYRTAGNKRRDCNMRQVRETPK